MFQVTCWSKNYNTAAGRNYSYYGYQPNDTDRFFETMSSATKPANGNASELFGYTIVSVVCALYSCMIAGWLRMSKYYNEMWRIGNWAKSLSASMNIIISAKGFYT